MCNESQPELLRPKVFPTCEIFLDFDHYSATKSTSLIVCKYCAIPSGIQVDLSNELLMSFCDSGYFQKGGGEDLH